MYCIVCGVPGCDHKKHMKYGIENDFCPMSKLRSCDFAFVRKGFALDKLLASDDKYLNAIKAKIMKWEDGKELLANFKQAIPEIDWNMNHS